MSAKNHYAHERGDKGAYQRYLDGMDSSMRQKVALVAAHLRSHGQVADMGMGSGTGSHALAALYPSLDVVGVDLDPTMVKLAGERYDLHNLSFQQGDIAKRVFPDGGLEAIINSSVLHHVTSFGGYKAANAANAVETQVGQLREHGVIIIRDFLAPKDAEVYLDVPGDDGDGSDEPATCSTSVLLEHFANDFRSLSDTPGFPLTLGDDLVAPLPALRSGWARFRLSLRHATEFILRKDYRRDYKKEAKEEYTYFTQEEFEDLFGRLGLRVLTSSPLRNPWIVNNRYKGKLALWSASGDAIEFPATNYIIVGEKVAKGEGVRFRQGETRPPLGFLRMQHHRNSETGRVADLVSRPGRTFDILPWFEQEGDFFVLARASYPRPISQVLCTEDTSLDGVRAAGYVTEPLVVIQTDKPLGTTIEDTLLTDAGIESHQIGSFLTGTTYYPSPGGIEEAVTSALVEVEPTFEARPTKNRGRVMAIEAQQLLRSAQVGGLLDARLELNVYELLLQQGQSVGPWIGEQVRLANGTEPEHIVDLGVLLSRPHRRVFERTSEVAGFLELHCNDFEELNSAGAIAHSAPLEYVLPRQLTHRTVACSLLRQHQGTIFIAVDDDDLPAAQSFTGNSELLVTPAWRLPREVTSLTPALVWVRDRIQTEYGASCSKSWALGSRYHPSLGVTPEVVHTFAFEVLDQTRESENLHWVSLRELIAKRHLLQDGHLRISSMRAAHALGMLG